MKREYGKKDNCDFHKKRATAFFMYLSAKFFDVTDWKWPRGNTVFYQISAEESTFSLKMSPQTSKHGSAHLSWLAKVLFSFDHMLEPWSIDIG